MIRTYAYIIHFSRKTVTDRKKIFKFHKFYKRKKHQMKVLFATSIHIFIKLRKHFESLAHLHIALIRCIRVKCKH